MQWSWLVPVLIVLVIFGGPLIGRLTEGRRKFLLELKREERLIAEARTKEQELEHKRGGLEYRGALRGLGRFDRRTGEGTGGAGGGTGGAGGGPGRAGEGSGDGR